MPSLLRLAMLLTVLAAAYQYKWGSGLLVTRSHQPAERLSRGLTVMRIAETRAVLSWRFLESDSPNLSFQVYRFEDQGPGVLLNSQPLADVTFFVDESANFDRENLWVVHAVLNGVELDENPVAYLPANAPVQPYLTIPLEAPPGGATPDGVAFTYSANDASAGDLDGDGEYEIILKWDPSNSKDNSQSGYTGNVFLDAYRLNGARLWRLDLGPNIRAGAHYTQFLVYDLDGDGRAEVALKTAPGSRDGSGQFIAAHLADPRADYRNAAGYVLKGPEFFTIFDGLTGRELVTERFHPPRNGNPESADVSAWGDNYGNRVDRFLGAVAYLDGERPSLIFSRGYYTRTVLDAWNWRDGNLTRVWTFDSRDGTARSRAYEGQGNHSLSIADVDADGRDEILFGAATIDDDGTGLYTTGLGHGDAFHVGDLLPARPGIEAYQPHETPSLYRFQALELRDAKTGELLCGVESTGDIGRGVAADIDPRHPGAEFWGSGATGGLYSASLCEPNAEKGPRARAISPRKPAQINFVLWWDADPLRELLDGITISKWDWLAEVSRPLFTATGAASNNGTKSTPALTADLLGDWREEVVWRNQASTELRVYMSPVPPVNRRVTLMQDRQYRLAIAWQNVGYNQPPHPSFALSVQPPE